MLLTCVVTYALLDNPWQFAFRARSSGLATTMIVALFITPRAGAFAALISLFLLLGLFVRCATTSPTAGGALSFARSLSAPGATPSNGRRHPSTWVAAYRWFRCAQACVVRSGTGYGRVPS